MVRMIISDDREQIERGMTESARERTQSRWVRALICWCHLRSAPPQKNWHAAEDLWCAPQSAQKQTAIAMSALPS
jgi:hypothetical protein